jgi:hypothetical protein
MNRDPQKDPSSLPPAPDLSETTPRIGTPTDWLTRQRIGGAAVEHGDVARVVGPNDLSDTYPTDDELIARIHSRSELLDGDRSLVGRIGTMITRRGDNPGADKALLDCRDAVAASAERQGIFDKSPVEVILDHINFCRGVDTIKRRVTSPGSPTDRSNALMIFMGDEIIKRVPRDKVTEYISASIDISNRLRSLPSDQDRWSLSKIHGMLGTLRQREEAYQYADELSSRREPVAAEKMESDRLDIEAAFAEVLRERREYGVKLSYIESGLTGSLVFSESSEFFGEIGPTAHRLTYGIGEVQAVVVHSRNRTFETLEVGKKHDERFSDTASLSYSDIGSLNGYAVLHLGRDGELYADNRCQFPLSASFAETGKYSMYRRLQGEIIANFFDLVTSEEIASTVGTPGGPKPAPTNHEQPGDPVDVLYDLLVPRIEASERPRKKTEEPQEPLGIIRVHDVAYHKMKLQPGWKPSPRALELAREVDYKIPEGYTFVKAHKRGNPQRGAVKGYHARHRDKK